mmetsp:Transcript_10197/g.30263  ORF Transcript_10197/g.30263 Transcript_10197/m.30263 type:complete len:188 (-) Transcript_10197:66-629(-)
MTLLRADMKVLAQSMTAKCPKVSRCMAANGVELTAICSEWFITWFAKCLPISTILRVWDTLFFEGFKVLFRIALGVFKRAEAEVLKANEFGAIMEQAKTWPRAMVQHNELLKASFGGVPGFSRKYLLAARDVALSEVEAEDEERNRRIAESRLRVEQRRAEDAAKKAEAARLAEAQAAQATPGGLDA